MSRDAALDALISAKVGGEPFATFFEIGEGRIFPRGKEDQSGFVVTASGAHYFYWTCWASLGLVLGEWSDERAQEDWADSDEYRDARTAVGLP